MKLAEYKALVKTNPKLAMLIDLSERHPRGPDALLRGHNYRQLAGTGWYNRHEVEIDVETLKKSTDVILEKITADEKTCLESFGYPVIELLAWFKKNNIRDGYDFKRSFSSCIECRDELSEVEKSLQEQFLGWNKQATRTRRSKRLGLRFRQLTKWIERNITTAYYRVNTGYGGGGDIFIHADSEASALSQFELFIQPAMDKLADLNRGSKYYTAQYSEPALEGPVGLMTKNQRHSDNIDREVSDLQHRIEKMNEKIEVLTTAKMMVNQYTINMTCSYNYKNEEN